MVEYRWVFSLIRILNDVKYPEEDYHLSFANSQLSTIHNDASEFGVKFNRINKLVTQSNISPYELLRAVICKDQ